MATSQELQREFDTIITAAYRVSADVGREVEEALRLGVEAPLTEEEATRLLSKTVTLLRARAEVRGDSEAMSSMAGDISEIVAQVISMRDRLVEKTEKPSSRVDLVARSGVTPGPVFPTPVFHGREIPMNAGFVKTSDIALWDRNERLEIHLAQFREKNGRKPTPEELLDIMLSRMDLPGIAEDDRKDQFHIVDLARSIAVNGVRKAPIIARDGRLLDGNRRIAACYYILHSDEFDSVQKQRAEWVYTWQLTEHATPDQEELVVVSLNFEADHKEPWPEYVKARKIFEEWQAVLTAEPRTPHSKRQAELKRGLSQRFALGPDTRIVNRYIKMVRWASDFEDYHIADKSRDEFEVKHKASKYFQYFDELAKGETGGVAKALTEDVNYRNLVFDLLFQDRFKNWRQIRDLRRIHENEEALAELRKARSAEDPDEAEDHIDNAITIARAKQAENRTLGANTRIEGFTQWLSELPVSAFRDQIRPENLKRLLRALELVQRHVQAMLKVRGNE